MLETFARAVFAVVGAVAITVSFGQVTSLLSPGTRFDPVPILWGIGLGTGAFAAAVWVRSAGAAHRAAAWAGIGLMAATSLWPISYLLTHPDAGPDVVALAIVPTLIGLAASAVMARARMRPVQAE